MNTSQTIKNLISALIAFCVAALVFVVIGFSLNSTVSRVLLTAVFTGDTDVHISEIAEDGRETLIDVIQVQANPSSSQYVGTKQLNQRFEKLKLNFISPQSTTKDSSGETAQVVIHNVQIQQPYAQDTFISDHRVLEFFDGSKANPNKDLLAVANADYANSLISKNTISKPDYYKAIGFALLFGFGLFFIFRHADWLKIPAFADMSLGREVSSSHEFGSINGLRGIAALMVLMSHSAPGFETNGVGLAMLFVISGFLLSKPFILDPNKIFSLYNIEVFILKRLKRILPMYYLYIFVSYVVTLQMDTALRHFLFVQAEGHLWPMTQIFGFYMLLPLVLLASSLLFKVTRFLPIIVLSVAAYYWWANFSQWRPFYNGQYFHEFYLYAFLMGVIAAYLQYGFIGKSATLLSSFRRWAGPIAILGMSITIVTIAWSAPLQPPQWASGYISQFYIKCLLCVLILLLSLNTVGTWFNAFMSNWLFRSVGIVGFSFYILHGLGMQIVINAQQQLFAIADPSHRSWGFTFMAFLVTYLMSIVTYSYVERPFFGFRKTRNNVE